MKIYNVLVTGVGGVVGQGVCQNIRGNFDDIFIVGVNSGDPGAGKKFVDIFLDVPWGDSVDYIDCINSIVKDHNVDLIIPATDLEMLVLSSVKETLPVASSSKKASEIFYDKYQTFSFFSSLGIPFARAVLPSNYEGSFDKVIAKPKSGRGSRGILKNFDVRNIQDLDDSYMIQELHDGKEITSSFFVDKHNNFYGPISFERELTNGTTTKVIVNREFDSELKEKVISPLIQNLNLYGSINIQFIGNDKGIFPFEINGRISGTNSLRDGFGFKDVKYLLDDFLFDKKPDYTRHSSGHAFRYLSDMYFLDEE